VLRADPSAPSVGWPLRGELVTHLDRLRTELNPPPPRPYPPPPDATASETWRHRLRSTAERWRNWRR